MGYQQEGTTHSLSASVSPQLQVCSYKSLITDTLGKVVKTRFDPCHNSMQNGSDLNTATPDWSDENIIS